MIDRSGDTATSSRPRLRAIAGGRRAEHGPREARRAPGAPGGGAAGGAHAAGGGAAGFPIGTAPDECAISRAAVRAGDRHEPWTLPSSPALHALAASAAAAGTDFELAVRVAVEHALVCGDLSAAGVDPARLDAAAAATRIEASADAASAAYLRRLTQGCAKNQALELGEAVTVGLPQRLSARLLRADLDALLAAPDLRRAIAWEVAAVVEGRTLSEWAPLAALRTPA